MLCLIFVVGVGELFRLSLIDDFFFFFFLGGGCVDPWSLACLVPYTKPAVLHERQSSFMPPLVSLNTLSLGVVTEDRSSVSA